MVWVGLLLLGVVAVVVVRISVGAFISLELLLLEHGLLHDLVGLPRLIQLSRVQSLQVLLLLQVLVEGRQLGAQAKNVLHLAQKDVVKLVYVLLDIALGLLHVLEYAHV